MTKFWGRIIVRWSWYLICNNDVETVHWSTSEAGENCAQFSPYPRKFSAENFLWSLFGTPVNSFRSIFQYAK